MELKSSLREELLETLRARFEENMDRHPVLQWEEIRRNVCYDDEALESRKKHKPKASAVGIAAASWVLTPPDIRRRGGGIFGDFRFGTVFIYHNGAESYYAAHGFRCVFRV